MHTQSICHIDHVAQSMFHSLLSGLATFRGSVVTRGWLSMAPGLNTALAPSAPRTHWLSESGVSCCRGKQMSVELSGRRSEEGTDFSHPAPSRRTIVAFRTCDHDVQSNALTTELPPR